MESMLYIVDNALNYLIYLFIIHFGWKINARKNKLYPVLSVVVMFSAGIFNGILDSNTFIVYIIWSVVSIELFFEDNVLHLLLMAFSLMYFTGIIDTFTVMLLQIILVGGGIGNVDLAWWMEPAYILSFVIYLMVYLKLLKKNNIYLCDINLKYKLTILIQGSIFQLFYNFIFSFFEFNNTRYSLNAYITFWISIIGVIYSIFITLSLAIKKILSDRQNDELQALIYMQKQQYDYQMQQTNTIRRFRHDLVNHMGILRELIRLKKEKEAEEYIEKIWNITENFNLQIHTGDGILDVILNYYHYLAEKNKIDFKIFGKLSNPLMMEKVDVTIVIGNILQNALEASVQSDNPWITMKIIEHQKEIFIEVSNTAKKKIKDQGDFFRTTKEDVYNHGIGIQNIIDTITKYHGESFFEEKNKNNENIFQVKVTIPKEMKSNENRNC